MAGSKNIYAFSDWDNAHLHQGEKDTINTVRQRAAAGEISWADAHRTAEHIRAKHGYSGGETGGDYIEKRQTIDTQYSNPSKQNAIRDQMNRVMGSSYEDFVNGADYAALLDKYTKAGRRAMDDTMGTAAARTGGMASSYATVAGQQAFNRYMEGLDDSARALYQQEYEREKDRLQMLREDEQTDYGRFLDALENRRTERAYDRQVDQDILAKRQYDDAVAREQDNTEWSRAQQTEAAERETAATATASAQQQIAQMLATGKIKLADIDPKLIEQAKAGDTGWSNDYLRILEMESTQPAANPTLKRGPQGDPPDDLPDDLPGDPDVSWQFKRSVGAIVRQIDNKQVHNAAMAGVKEVWDGASPEEKAYLQQQLALRGVKYP